MTSLGSCLKSLRKSNNLTLKYIEDNLGISNAYLSQLENDKIKTQLNSRIAFSTEKMSKEEKEEVLEYLKFLKSKRK